MRTGIVSSSALRDGPWGAEHHLPPADPTPQARAIDDTLRLLTRLRAEHPDTATPEEWNTALTLLHEQADARARRDPRHANHADRAAARADRELLAPWTEEPRA